MTAEHRAGINWSWEYTDHWSEDFANGKGTFSVVNLPHQPGTIPDHYADPENYLRLCGYRKRLRIPEDLQISSKGEGKRYFIQFDGAAHSAELFINGESVAAHKCGYTAFRVELTPYIEQAKELILSVRLDTSENPEIPPFGNVVDYLAYGGLYREVWIEKRADSFIKDLFVTTPEGEKARVAYELEGSGDILMFSVYDSQKVLQVKEEILQADQTSGDIEIPVSQVQLWHPDHPHLYCLKAELIRNGKVIDTVTETFGFRYFEWKADGFYLNGERFFFRGLNRHQAYPEIGYAATASLQREDARILKEELGCNAVRTSHYPQSQSFLNACDELGLLVFTEIPGWQHIGGEQWKEQAAENLTDMILQNRNHPCIFLWGVRINESIDDDAFYSKMNELAHKLDPSRATSGVRYLEKSHLLEDVYAYNDFSFTGENVPVRKKKDVTTNNQKAFFISEANGHMFPTKSSDPWSHRQEHALRHAKVLDSAIRSGEHAGCFQWCMFDYQTHKDFGSGDRICYHGVMDRYRNGKLAAALYASQSDSEPILEIGSSMDIGDYPAGKIGAVYAFTNAEEVRLYKNDQLVQTFRPKVDGGLKHPPVCIDDFIGDLLETREHYEPAKARLLKECLKAAGEYGISNLPLKYKLKLARCMIQYKMKFEDGVRLFGEYVGNWGGEATRWRFDAVSGGEIVRSVTRCGSSKLHMEVRTSTDKLVNGETYDMAALRIRILDEYNNLCPYAQIPIRIDVTGDAELAGASIRTCEGGMTGFYIRSKKEIENGEAQVTISAEGLEPICIRFSVTK